MAFAQLIGRDGLRDIEVCLQLQQDKLYLVVVIFEVIE